MEQDLSIPPELENMLLEFTINALVMQPADYASHAADYFTLLRDGKSLPTPLAKKASSSRSLQGSRRASRRPAIMGESYNPEDDEQDDDLDQDVSPKTDEERDRIKAATKNAFLFRVLDDAGLGAVIDAMIPVPVEEGQVVIREGDDGDYFYLVDRGVFEIYKKDADGVEKQVNRYDNEGYFGELALLHNQPRAATVKAVSEGALWAVSRKTFQKRIVKRAFRKRQMYMQLLDSVPQLEPLSEYEKMQVADALQGKIYSEGDVVVNEGDEGDGMYFIVSGKVSVRQQKMRRDGEEAESEEIGQLEKGEYFGELALVKDQPRAATIVALERTEAAFLDVKAFERLLGPCMELMKRQTEAYAKQSKSAEKAAKKSKSKEASARKSKSKEASPKKSKSKDM